MQAKRPIIVLLILSVPVGVAAEGFDPAARAKAIAPFVEEQTIGVAHVDLDFGSAAGAERLRLDLDALKSWCASLLELVEPDPESRDHSITELRETRAATEKWIHDFNRAGGTAIFAVMSLADVISDDSAFLVVPLAPGAEADAIADLLGCRPPDDPTDGSAEASRTSRVNRVTQRIGNAVVAGSPDTLRRLRTATPAPRPEVARAFEAAGDTTIQVLLLPTPDCRRVVEEMIPTLPLQLGGGPVTALTRGALWAALGIDTHPAVSLRLVLQSESAEGAQAAQAVIDALFKFLGTDASVRSLVPDAETILASVQRTVTGDRVQLTITPESSKNLIAMITRPIEQARQRSNRLASAEQMKSIMLACIMYTRDHKNQWPPDLQTLVDAKLIPPQLLIHPLRPDEKVGFIYRKPVLPIDKVDPLGAVIHEPYDSWTDGIWVAYVDGHVQFISNEAELLEALARTQRPVEE